MSKMMKCPKCEHVFESSNRESGEVTEREWETAMLVVRGMTAKEVARQLCISDKTVKNHLTSVYRKLHLKNKVDLLKLLLMDGRITVEDIGSLGKSSEKCI